MTEALTLLKEGADMPWELLLPLIMKLLESLVKKNDEAAKAGFSGPLTAYFAARSPALGVADDQDAFKAFCEAYLRCCK